MLIRADLDDKHAGFSWKPDYIAASIVDIDFSYLRSQGIKACFIDLDGTVVARGTYDVAVDTAAYLSDQKMPIYIATNRPRSRELKNLKEDLSASGVIHPQGLSGKPFRRYFLDALQKYNLKPPEVVMIGDRFIQDVIGANGVGIYSLVVHKLDRPVNRFDAVLSSLEARSITRLSGKYRKQ